MIESGRVVVPFSFITISVAVKVPSVDTVKVGITSVELEIVNPGEAVQLSEQ